MSENCKSWIVFWVTVLLILGALLLAMLHLAEKVENHSHLWEEQAHVKQTQELDSIRVSEED